MAVELARTNSLPKPWGVADLRPWSNDQQNNNLIGEIWYERPDRADAHPSLLLKLLFTSQPLSIQVHPDDAFARSIGLPNGKSEAWFVLSATPEAKVALGLKRSATSQELREAIDDGSIVNLVAWRTASAGDIIYVPAGTIHAIGAGLVIAEIQQRSDATFRLFDYGRHRELHVENALAVASTTSADSQPLPTHLNKQRTILVSSPHFIFEKIALPPNSAWNLKAERETWILVINGSMRVSSIDAGVRSGSLDAFTGSVIFLQSENVEVHASSMGMEALVAYGGSTPIRHLLRQLDQLAPIDRRDSQELSAFTPAKTAQ